MERIKLNIQKFAADNTVEVELVATVTELEKSINSAAKTLGTLKGQIKGTTSETNNLKTAAQGLSKAFSGINISGAIRQIRNLGKSLYSDFLTKAIDTSEELNLFNVVFDNMEKNGKTTFSSLGKEAIQFQNKLNEAFGTNRKETMRYQGLFQAMGESAGLDEKTSKFMSENMTKLAYDLASLYNTSEQKAAESLRAGVYAGQTKPLRNYGIDVTQTSYKPLMEELGLDKSVSELTQAEKEVLRYISTLRQAGNAMGDFANTIESPANQLKILRQQFYEMQAAIGNLFVGAFAKILPYANAVIMVIKEVAQTIASLFGIEMSDYNSGIASYADDLEEYSDSLDGVGSSAGGASKAIEKLKRQTLAFDQINNLTTPTPNSSSGGGGGGASGGLLGGVDDKLLAALKGYNNGMDKVKMKATEIRDKMMDILGFTKHINAETGETYFTYDGWQETVKGLWGWFKELNPLAKIFVGIGLPAAFITLFNVIKKIAGATGVTSVLKGILNISKNLLSPLKDLGSSMLSFSKAALQSTGGIKNLGEGLALGIESWREQQGIIDKTTGKLNGFQGVVAGTKNVLLGLGEAAIGIYSLSKSVDDLTMNGANLGNVMGTAGGTIMTIFGGAQAGAVFGPWGAAIGAVTGAVVSLGTVLLSTNDELDKSIKKVNEASDKNREYFENLERVRGENKRLLDESLGMTDYHEKLVKELKTIVDENGNVKKGYEDRAEYIVTTLAEAYGLEISYSDGIIQGYKDQIDNIDQLIDKEKERIRFEALKKQFEENIKNEVEARKKLKNEADQLNKSEKNLLKIREEIDEFQKTNNPNVFKLISLTKQLEDAEKSYNTTKKDTNKAFKTYYKSLLEQDTYERAMIEHKKGNWEEANRILQESTEEQTQHLKQSMIDQAKIVEDFSPDIIDKWKSLAAYSEKEYLDAISQLPDDTATQIQLLTGKIVKVTPEVVDHFANLGEQSEQQLILELKELPEDLQKDVIDKLKAKGVKIPEEIQKGIDSKPKPKAEIETSSKQEVQNKVNNSTAGVSGSVNVNANMPSTWSMQNLLDNNLRGVRGTINIAFGTGGGGGFRANGGVFANGRWQPIQAYANGGVPSGGQLFMAREAGPELVGKIGHHTAVMNNNQIVDSVKAGVYEAVSAAMSEGGMGSVQIDLHTDEGVVVDRINRITRQTGNCPIEI